MSNPIVEFRSGMQERTSRRAILRGFAGGAATAAFLAAGWTVDASNPPEYTVDGAGNGSVEGAIDIVFLFGQPSNPTAFEEYYTKTHLPMAMRMPVLQRLESCRALGNASGGAPIFHRMAVLRFESRAHMEASLSSSEGVAAFADIANFATGGVTATIVEDLKVVEVEPVTESSAQDVPDPRTPD